MGRDRVWEYRGDWVPVRESGDVSVGVVWRGQGAEEGEEELVLNYLTYLGMHVLYSEYSTGSMGGYLFGLN